MILSPGVNILVKEEGTGDFVVMESHGLFAYPDDKVELAKNTGLWDAKLTDAQLAERMHDNGFKDYIQNLIKKKKSNMLTAGEFVYDNYSYEKIGQKVVNNTDQEINASDYTLTIKETYYNWAEEDFKTDKKTEKGKFIPPYGSVTFDCIYSYYDDYGSGPELSRINIKIPDEEILRRFLKFTGNEYRDYLDSKAKESNKSKK